MSPDDPDADRRHADPRVVELRPGGVAADRPGRDRPGPLLLPVLATDEAAIERATLAETVAAAALHLCCLNVPWHALNMALAAADKSTPSTELLRQVAIVGSYGREVEAAMAAWDMLDMACRAWAPHAHPIGRAAGPWSYDRR